MAMETLLICGLLPLFLIRSLASAYGDLCWNKEPECRHVAMLGETDDYCYLFEHCCQNSLMIEGCEFIDNICGFNNKGRVTVCFGGNCTNTSEYASRVKIYKLEEDEKDMRIWAEDSWNNFFIYVVGGLLVMIAVIAWAVIHKRLIGDY